MNLDDYQRWVDSKRYPVCIHCKKPAGELRAFYVVNPPGGYGRSEVLLGVECLHLSATRGMYELLLERGQLEPQDVLGGDSA